MSSVEDEARRLYETCAKVAPRWDQLGEVTKGVWREYAQRGSVLTTKTPEPIPAPGKNLELF